MGWAVPNSFQNKLWFIFGYSDKSDIIWFAFRNISLNFYFSFFDNLIFPGLPHMTRKVTIISKQQTMLNLNTRMLLHSSVTNALRGFTQSKQRSTTKNWSILILTTGRSVMSVVKLSLLKYLWQISSWRKKYTIAHFVILNSS